MTRRSDLRPIPLRSFMELNIDSAATIQTDEHKAYRQAARSFAAHKAVNHGSRQYVAQDGTNSNEVEAYFSLLKRGIYGTFHHVSPRADRTDERTLLDAGPRIWRACGQPEVRRGRSLRRFKGYMVKNAQHGTHDTGTIRCG